MPPILCYNLASIFSFVSFSALSPFRWQSLFFPRSDVLSSSTGVLQHLDLLLAHSTVCLLTSTLVTLSSHQLPSRRRYASGVKPSHLSVDDSLLSLSTRCKRLRQSYLTCFCFFDLFPLSEPQKATHKAAAL